MSVAHAMFALRSARVEVMDLPGREARIATAWAAKPADIRSMMDTVVRSSRPAGGVAGSHGEPEPAEPPEVIVSIEDMVRERVASEVLLQVRAAVESERTELNLAHAEALASAVTTARSEAEAIGLETGRLLGRADRDVEMQEMQEALAGSLATFTAASEALRSAARKDAAELAFELARAVVGSALDLSPEALAVVFERAFMAVPQGLAATVRCHPEDAPVARRLVAEQGGVRGGEAWTLEESAALPRGAVRIEMAQGTVAAHGRGLLEALITVVKERLGLEAAAS